MLSWRERQPKVSLSISVPDAKAEEPDHLTTEPSDLRPSIAIPRHSTVTEYLRDVSPSFRKLEELRIKGWENPDGDTYFRKQRLAVDNASLILQNRLFDMMRSLGKEMDATTGAFFCPHRYPHILDLCMAPGGYTASVLDRHPNASVRGISLPTSLGGHNLLVPHDEMDPRVQVRLVDITMLASEFGVCSDDIPYGHPEASQFNGAQPYHGEEFDIVFCDGQVLRTHPRAEWREHCEATRLTVSQLILGLQRIKTGGTFIMLLHKMEAWNTCTLLKAFEAFSTVVLFKPQRSHATRSSFYLVAKNVQPESSAAKEAVQEWKKVWFETTFEGDATREGPSEGVVNAFLTDYGPRLVELGRGIWEIQARALESAPYIRRAGRTKGATPGKLRSFEARRIPPTSTGMPKSRGLR